MFESPFWIIKQSSSPLLNFIRNLGRSSKSVKSGLWFGLGFENAVQDGRKEGLARVVFADEEIQVAQFHLGGSKWPEIGQFY